MTEYQSMDEPIQERLRTLCELKEEYRALLHTGEVPFELALDPDSYNETVYYSLEPGERDIAEPGLAVLREVGTFDGRITGVYPRSYLDPSTHRDEECMILQLTDGWVFVPTVQDLEELRLALGNDWPDYIGIRLRLVFGCD